MSIETQKDQLQNITFNHMVDGIFTHAKEVEPRYISYDPSRQAETINIYSSRVNIRLARPTLDGEKSEAWEAPWDYQTKLRMRIELKSLNGNQFGFKDTDENIYLLDSVSLMVLDDGSVRPFFENDNDHKVGEPVSEKYLLELIGSEDGEFEPVLAER